MSEWESKKERQRKSVVKLDRKQHWGIILVSFTLHTLLSMWLFWNVQCVLQNAHTYIACVFKQPQYNKVKCNLTYRKSSFLFTCHHKYNTQYVCLYTMHVEYICLYYISHVLYLKKFAIYVYEHLTSRRRF